MEPQTNPFDAPQTTPTPDNSQPTNTPSTAPVPPAAAPITPATPVTPPVDPNTPKKSKLGLILGLSIGGGVLLIGIIVTVLLLVLNMGLSKSDWQTAIDHANKISTIMSDDSALSAASSLDSDSTASDVTTAANQIKTFRTNLQQAMTDLGNTKAIKNDKTAQAKFQTLQSKYTAFDQQINSMYEVLNQCGSAIVVMTSMGSLDYSDASAAQTVLSGMKSAASQLSSATLSDSNLNSTTHAMADKMSALATALSNYLNNSSDLTAMDNFYNALDDFETASGNWTDAINKIADSSASSDFETAFNDLATYMNSQLLGK